MERTSIAMEKESTRATALTDTHARLAYAHAYVGTQSMGRSLAPVAQLHSHMDHVRYVDFDGER